MSDWARITVTANADGSVEAVVNGYRTVYHCGDEAKSFMAAVGIAVSSHGSAAVARRVQKGGAQVSADIFGRRKRAG